MTTTTDQLIASVDADGTRYVRKTGPAFAQRPWYEGRVYAVRELLVGETLTSARGLLDETTTHWATREAAEARATERAAEGWTVAVVEVR